MAFRNIPPNGFPAIPDIEDLDSVVKDVDTLKTTAAALAEDVGDLNTSKAGKADIATEFSDLTNYNAGDLVYYEGALYEFQVDHAAGDWETSEVIQKDLSDIVTTLKSGLTNVVKTVTETLTSSQYKWITFPAGREILGAYMTIGNNYLSFIVNFDANVGGYITNMYINTNGQTVDYTKLDANTDYTVTYKYI